MSDTNSDECPGPLSEFDVFGWAERVRGAMASDDVKITRLAALSGVHRETIRAILACERPNPSIATVVAISRGLELARAEALARREMAMARAPQNYPQIARKD